MIVATLKHAAMIGSSMIRQFRIAAVCGPHCRLSQVGPFNIPAPGPVPLELPRRAEHDGARQPQALRLSA